MTSKKFAFAEKYKMPFYFVSAAEGTNVVAAFEHALKLALDNKLNPPDRFMKDLDDMLADVNRFQVGHGIKWREFMGGIGGLVSKLKQARNPVWKYNEGFFLF